MKKFVLIVVAVVATPLLAVLLLLLSFDANRYKPELIALGRELSGREFDIRGEISLKPALTPTLVASGVTLGNAAWGQHANMLEIGRFEGQVRLLPLLQHRVEIKRLVLHGLHIVLERDGEGRGNWAFDGEPGAPATVSSPAAAAPVFDLDDVTIKDSRLEYRRRDGTGTVLAITHMTLLPEGVGQPLRLRASLLYDERTVDLGARLAPLTHLFNNEPYAVEVRFSANEIRFEASGNIARPLDADGVELGFEMSAPFVSLFPGKSSASLPADEMFRSSGTLRHDDGAYRIEAFRLSFGPSALDGSIALDLDGERPELALEFNAEHIDLSMFGRTAADAPADGRVFSTAPLPFALLDALDFKLGATVGELKLAESELETVRLAATLDDRRLRVSQFSALIDKGTLVASLDIDAARDVPRVRHTLKLDNVSMTPLVSKAAANRFRGGRVRLALEVDSKGQSMAELAAASNGSAVVSVHEVDIASRGASLASTDLMLNAFSLLNPLARSNDHELVECAVFNFPITDGRAAAATGIGIRTRRLSILGGGTIDLASERLDIGVNPKPREGLGLNLAGFADFIRIGGTLREPVPTTDGAGMASAGVKVGAAFATGGLSLLAEGLLDRAGSDVDVCAVAAGSAELPGSEDKETSILSRAADSTSSALEQAGSAVKGTFKRLFGD